MDCQAIMAKMKRMTLKTIIRATLKEKTKQKTKQNKTKQNKNKNKKKKNKDLIIINMVIKEKKMNDFFPKPLTPFA